MYACMYLYRYTLINMHVIEELKGASIYIDRYRYRYICD